jgi:signal transduction histidine kinase
VIPTLTWATYRECMAGSAQVSRLLDIALAIGVTAVGVAETLVPFTSRAGEGSSAATVILTVVIGTALGFRRTHPAATLVVVAVALMAGYFLTAQYVLFFGQFIPFLIAVFSTARHGSGRVPFLGAAIGAALLLQVDLFVEELQSAGEIVFHWGVFAIVWGFGFGMRRHAHRAEESTRRAVEAEVAAAEQAMAAVLAERTRIARELHDIIAHSVSTMVVQAGAAEQIVREDPALVERALATIRTTGAGALDEMHRVVQMLRDGDDVDPKDLAPQPGLDGLPMLLSTTDASGLVTALEIHGERPPLPAGLELAGYRVVQEALTNVRRHSGAESVRVIVEHDPSQLRITVDDDGHGAAQRLDEESGGGGHGLVGMRERVAMYGGRVETGPGPRGGFMIQATFPLEQADFAGLGETARPAVPEATS